MKTVPSALAAHLKGEATTTCHCWKVSLRDGVIMGFTEHDEPLTFGGVTYLAASGFHASENDSETGLAASSGEVMRNTVSRFGLTWRLAWAMVFSYSKSVVLRRPRGR